MCTSPCACSRTPRCSAPPRGPARQMPPHVRAWPHAPSAASPTAALARPAVLLAAALLAGHVAQQQRVIHVLTHDSIGLGEDGPTHQPIEHVMSMRMIPNLDVYRPADIVETAECWELALRNDTGPSTLALVAAVQRLAALIRLLDLEADGQAISKRTETLAS